MMLTMWATASRLAADVERPLDKDLVMALYVEGKIEPWLRQQ